MSDTDSSTQTSASSSQFASPSSTPTEEKNEKSVTIDLEGSQIHYVCESRDRRDHHHHRAPIVPSTINLLDLYLHKRFLKKMRRKNQKLRRLSKEPVE